MLNSLIKLIVKLIFSIDISEKFNFDDRNTILH